MKLNEITIELTQKCPNQCIYCSSRSNIEKTEALDFGTVCKIIGDAKLLGAKTINLSGGEPFLRADIAKIVDYIHTQGIGIRVYTSGIYCINGQYSTIPVALLEAVKDKINAVIFNYEAIDAELYATIMGTDPANMYLLEETIKNAIALDIPVEAHLVPMHCNYRKIPEVLNKLFSMGVKNISILRLVPQGRVMENKELVVLSSDEQEELQQILTMSKEIYKGKIRLGSPFSSKRAPCGTGSLKLTVRYDGYVFPCEAFKDSMMVIVDDITPENVKNKSLKDIYKDSTYLKCVRDGSKGYLGHHNNECCFGQYCRKVYLD
jgi:MoaA/NifB/PqqE/SkfB family radical SAM enzyme